MFTMLQHLIIMCLTLSRDCW